MFLAQERLKTSGSAVSAVSVNVSPYLALLRTFHPTQAMARKTSTTAATQAITAPPALTQPLARAGPPEPSNPDNPWGLKDTFRWLVSLLRSHNALLDSHIELQRTVTDLRQNVLELARLPITAPIWCEQGIEAIVPPQDEPLFPPGPTYSPEQAQQEEQAEDTPPDKRPMESQAWTDDNIRQALEAAHLQAAIHQSKQPQFPHSSPTAKHPAASSATGTTVQPQNHTQKQTQKPKQRTPPEHKTSKPTKTTKATQQTPVKAMPLNRPTLINKTSKQQAKDTSAEPHVPSPKRRHTKTTPAEQLSYQEPFAEEAIFEQFAEEESPTIPSPEFEGPVEPVAPVESTRKKRRKQ